ncbi:MAG: tRNA (N6-isopentenyl adenosine(37)-C2)-methylthiotransferase MiaB [Dehalococcoidales bacterium]|jgi:tRNA-2-methylthio-N6-dimethylallyladenosine synthase|nr:tRNA (N6-isopentenyl adenosine(37)-C2)-methylthiotransferase MiaB [Dehalococcoidales bacterium]MDD3264444.1 tRNA (N6-isopentenyl adenosine(37)-C2)-methylthiotransferase MiaB [Dehalococcoidales bacterium]MDD4322870.1 tRNA (N6-isopentenyl adenosine(37)-C2)-methylthiotransferase MiaB [Dehalococcoidales bacterium]MDD4793965.1 tRNA (N6-isopentenyl adenosine(37)-C2)-methylthiotransferase MiaB [Dehalococcoidales bacterium]MDD5121961.1 tRNA (N6-isopentenyl adenosine(37)-C2)-methylthiotransferase Mia
MPSYNIWTIGCQMNRAESERLEALLENHGYTGVAKAEDAGLVIVNSCVVRQSAENRVINKLMRLRYLKRSHPGLKIALTGCFVTSDIAQMRKKYPFVDYFFTAGSSPTFTDLVDVESYSLPRPAAISSGLTIIQGCDNFCSYCIVPYRRGREQSRQVADIESEARYLVEGGARELVLLGQNVDSYGHDLPDKADLASLLEHINCIDGLYRIRFLTNHPKDMSERLINSMASLDKVCQQLNLPVQSGDDDILQRMKRGYNLAHYRKLLEGLRSGVPGVAITTDIIVGFPGESREQFDNTLKFLEEARFDAVHVAAYSPRPQTLASLVYTDDIDPSEKDRRRKLIEEAQSRISAEINSGLVGQTVEVLVEGRKKGKWYGRSRTDKLVFFEHPGNWLGRQVPVKIEHSSPWFLKGSI